jgi:hypothetical protein
VHGALLPPLAGVGAVSRLDVDPDAGSAGSNAATMATPRAHG